MFFSGSQEYKRDPAGFFLKNIQVMGEVIRTTCCRYNIKGTEAEDFASMVHLKLIEQEYKAIRAFQGRSSFRTYLQTVVNRLYIDYRRQQKGRWRPSTQAQALGQAAEILEKLIVRDKYPFDFAYQMVTLTYRQNLTEDEAQKIWQSLKMYPDRHQKDCELLDEVERIQDPDLLPVEQLIAQEEEAKFLKLNTLMIELIQTFPLADRLLLKMRFVDDLKLNTISRILHKDRGTLERRLKSILAQFRQGILATAGIKEEDIREIFHNKEAAG